MRVVHCRSRSCHRISSIWSFRIYNYRFEGTEPIKVTVGTESKQKTWYLPKQVLTHCSPFFDAALNNNFAEASSKAVNLPEEDPAAFEIWTTWLSLGNCSASFECNSYHHAVVRAWILGDKLACPAFQDHVMFELLSMIHSGVDLWLDTIQVAYGVSSPGSKIRQFFVDWFVWDKLEGNLEQNADEIIKFLRQLPEFSDDVVRREVTAGKEVTRSPLEEQHRYYENPAFISSCYI